MSNSGRWWDDKKKMYGRVAHTHEGKTWLSKYSEDLGDNIEEAVSELEEEGYSEEEIRIIRMKFLSEVAN